MWTVPGSPRGIPVPVDQLRSGQCGLCMAGNRMIRYRYRIGCAGHRMVVSRDWHRHMSLDYIYSTAHVQDGDQQRLQQDVIQTHGIASQPGPNGNKQRRPISTGSSLG